MPISAKKLFSGGLKKHDGLTQKQREAIVDLLHYCMFADNFVALVEDQFVNTVAATLSWDKNISFESYEGGSIANARKAKESAHYREQFLKSIYQRLDNKESKSLALQLCTDLYNADSNMADAEARQLSVITSLLS